MVRPASKVVASYLALMLAGPLLLDAAGPAHKKLGGLDFRQVVAEAKDKVFPTVIYIRVLKESFEQGKKVSENVSGSGVIISAQGEAVTNWHVVDKAIEVRCLLYDGRALDAEVIGSDKDTDIALIKLKLEDQEDIPHAILGTSSGVKEGDFVMAMGAPWGLSRSVSIGIIACTQRYLEDHSEYNLWLQTDAAISPGNSGGPLVDTNGLIVGINTRGVMVGGDMGFAVPADTVRIILDQLREHGKMNWSWTGLQLQPLRDFNRDIYFQGTEGVIVAETDPSSPARLAGLLARDRIMKINGRPVSALTEESLPALRRQLGLLPKNEIVTLEVSRNDEIINVEIKPTEKGKVEGAELDCPRWDLTVKAINRFDNPQLYFYRQSGVFIYGVKYPGNASDSGLRSQDIILEIEGKKVETLEDVKAIHEEALEQVDTKPRIVFTLLRSGLPRQVVLDFARDYEKD